MIQKKYGYVSTNLKLIFCNAHNEEKIKNHVTNFLNNLNDYFSYLERLYSEYSKNEKYNKYKDNDINNKLTKIKLNIQSFKNNTINEIDELLISIIKILSFDDNVTLINSINNNNSNDYEIVTNYEIYNIIIQQFENYINNQSNKESNINQLICLFVYAQNIINQFYNFKPNTRSNKTSKIKNKNYKESKKTNSIIAKSSKKRTIKNSSFIGQLVSKTTNNEDKNNSYTSTDNFVLVSNLNNKDRYINELNIKLDNYLKFIAKCFNIYLLEINKNYFKDTTILSEKTFNIENLNLAFKNYSSKIIKIYKYINQFSEEIFKKLNSKGFKITLETKEFIDIVNANEVFQKFNVKNLEKIEILKKKINDKKYLFQQETIKKKEIKKLDEYLRNIISLPKKIFSNTK